MKEQEAGLPAVEVCRRHEVSSATFYKWKSKFSGMEMSEAKRLRSLEDENAKLKELLAAAMLDIAVLKKITGRKGSRPAQSGMQRCMPRWRSGCLNETLFTSLDHARADMVEWQHDYNTVRPYSKLVGRTPAEMGKQAVPEHVPALLVFPSTISQTMEGLYL